MDEDRKPTTPFARHLRGRQFRHGLARLPTLAACRKLRLHFLALGMLISSAGIPVPASAAIDTCEVALVLALDASSSVNGTEFKLQSRGLATALMDREVRAAILGVEGVLMTAYEWSGRRQQAIIAEWEFLASDADIDRFAAKLSSHKRAYVEFPTAVGYALGFGAVRLARAPMACTRQVIDVSGDGVHNEGFPPKSAYRAFDFGGVTVNGLVIKGADPDPEIYYRKNVLFGPGAFLEIAHDYQDYANAMKRKLLREIGGAMVSEIAGGNLKNP